MPLSTIDLPNVPSGWNKFAIITDGGGWKRPYEYVIPTNYLPSPKFEVANYYDNTLIMPLQFDSDILNIQTLPIGGGALASVGVSIPLFITLKRSGNTGNVGSSPYRDIMPSPRFGFSIGSLFKSQTYIKMDMVGYGYQVVPFGIQWIWVECAPYIETTANSRLKRAYVRHGKLLDAYVDTDIAGKEHRYWRVFDGDPPPKKFAPGGNITVYTKNGKWMKFTITGVTESWEVVTSKDPSSTNVVGSDGIVPSVDMEFYLISDKVWAVEDPRMFHEYTLVNGRGYYETTAQKFFYMPEQTKIIGIWIPPSGTGDLWTVYMDESERYKVPLPKNLVDAERSKEAMTYGGTLAEGITKFKALNPQPDTIRVVMNQVVGSKGAQNACMDNLTGEFLQMGDDSSDSKDFYEIAAQPRSDTIEVLIQSVVSKNKFTTTLASPSVANTTLYQQNFWITTEVYPGDVQTGFPQGLWTGSALTVSYNATTDETLVTWRGWESRVQTKTLQPELTPSTTTLMDRYRDNSNISATKVANAFVKFRGWKAYNRSGRESYEIKNATFTSLIQEQKIIVNAYFAGDRTKNIKVGDSLYVSFGEQYSPYLNINPSALLNYSFQTQPTLGADKQYRIWMNGFITVGGYKLAGDIPVGSRLSLVDFSYGGDWQSGDNSKLFGTPYVYLSTASTFSGLSYIDYCVGRKQLLFFKDFEHEIVAFRSGAPGYKSQREQRALVVGFPKTVKTAADFSGLDANAMITGLRFQMGRELSTNVEAYWLAIKKNSFATDLPYFSARISGQGGVDTPLLEKFDQVVEKTNASPIYLPFDFYPDSKSTSTQGASANNDSLMMDIPAYFKKDTGSGSSTGSVANLGVLQCGLERIDTDAKILNLIDGHPVTSGTIAYYPDSAEVSNNKQMIKGAYLFDVVASAEGDLVMFYGAHMPKVYIIGKNGAGDPSAATNAADEYVFAVASQNSGRYWGGLRCVFADSTSDGVTSNGGPKKKDVWGKPTAILPGFKYIQSILDKKIGLSMIFGYGYTRGSTTSGSGAGATTATSNTLIEDRLHLFAGVYKVNFRKFLSGPVYPIHTTAASGYQDGDIAAYYEDPLIKLDFGQPIKTSFTHSNGSDQDEEAMVKIVGGAQSGAQITDMVITDGIFSVSLDSSGTLVLLIRDETLGGYVPIVSNDAGATWTKQKDSTTKKPIIITEGEAPQMYIANKYHVFYFEDNVLKLRNIDVIDKQSHIDGVTPVVVATGVSQQRVSVGENAFGQIMVYYMSDGGYLSASSSENGGQTWHTMVNW